MNRPLQLPGLLALATVLATPLLADCSRSGASLGRSRAAVTGKAIGSPCEPEDGWMPAPETPPAKPAAGPVASPPPPGFQEHHSLAPGTGYCLEADKLYPYGYFTMNCKSDTDCPGKSRCDGFQCRLPCSSDQECTAPTRCGAPGGLLRVRYCSWFDNPALDEGQ
jgi:hypothetical protein